MALSTNHINRVLKDNPYTRKFFLGTFPSCAIEKLPKRKRYCFVTNVDHHSKGGSHWTAWFVDNGTVTFMDSFGRSPNHPSFPHDFRDILLKFKRFNYVKQQVQHVNSYACGYFTIHFLLCMCSNLGVDTFLSEFSEKTNKNDLVVMKIVKSLL